MKRKNVHACRELQLYLHKMMLCLCSRVCGEDLACSEIKSNQRRCLCCSNLPVCCSGEARSQNVSIDRKLREKCK